MKKKLKDYWRKKQDYSLAPWQGAICGSIAGGIAASITTPLGLIFYYFYLFDLIYFYYLDVAKTRIMLAHVNIKNIYSFFFLN